MDFTPEALALLQPIRIGDTPLHRQVEDRLRKLAGLREYQQGALLPDEMTLVRRLGVSRGTARAALTRLVQEGVVERRAGVGTRAARPRPSSGIRAWQSFSREMAAQGIIVENMATSCSMRALTQDAARSLDLAHPGRALRLDRVRGWDGKPVLLSRSWLHPRLQLGADLDASRPLYEMIEQSSGIVADSAHEEFSAVSANEQVAAQMRIKPGTPLLLRRHTVADPAGHPIEFAEVLYVSSRFALTLDLRKAPF